MESADALSHHDFAEDDDMLPKVLTLAPSLLPTPSFFYRVLCEQSPVP